MSTRAASLPFALYSASMRDTLTVRRSNWRNQAASVLALLRKYAERDIDLADACIVRMTELVRDCRVVTIDRAASAVYRCNGRDFIPIIAPPARRARDRRS
jgi:hypothetical protein